ncbi:MAG: S1C family serine protease [Holosporaceae bacterium]
MKKKVMVRCVRCVLLVWVCLVTASLGAAFEKQVLRRSIVSIKVRATRSAYNASGTWQGTGFLCDRKKGFIITNQHVAGYGVVATYEVTFFNGQKLPARIVYRDPWYDFAFLEIETPDAIPPKARALSQFKKASLGQKVYMMGNNQGRGFSSQEGSITSLYNDAGFMPQPAFSMLLNSRGGSSGSPLVNKDYQVLGLNYASNSRGTGFALHAALLQCALEALQKGQKPPRFHTGMMVRLRSLHKVMRYQLFPESIAKTYMQAYPKAEARVLMVVGTLKGSPAEGVLENGDVIWRVNGKPIAASATRLEACLNASGGKPVVIEFYRKGRLLKKKVGTYDLHPMTVSRLLVFGGATFFEADDQMRWQFGVAPKQLMVINVLPNSAFGRGLLPSFTNLSDEGRLSDRRACFLPEYSFEKLLNSIPALVKQKVFNIKVRWLTEISSGYDNIYFMTRALDTCGILYEVVHNTLPELIDYSFNQRTWQTSAILCHGDPA